MGWKKSIDGRQLKKRPSTKGVTGKAAPPKSASPLSKSSVARPPEFTVQFPPDWSEFFALLNLNHVRYLVVGAHALAVAGRPRATQDIDIFVEPSSQNAARLGAALRAFGFPALADESDRFATGNRMATLGNPPLQIDIMNAISGLSFAEAMATSVQVVVGSESVPFLGAEGLIANKSATGRAKDAADIALLREANP